MDITWLKLFNLVGLVTHCQPPRAHCSSHSGFPAAWYWGTNRFVMRTLPVLFSVHLVAVKRLYCLIPMFFIWYFLPITLPAFCLTNWSSAFWISDLVYYFVLFSFFNQRVPVSLCSVWSESFFFFLELELLQQLTCEFLFICFKSWKIGGRNTPKNKLKIKTPKHTNE